MKASFTKLLVLTVMTVMFNTSCFRAANNQTEDNRILYNQVAYISKAPKMILVANDIDEVLFLNQADEEIYRAKAEDPAYWDLAGSSMRKVYFSDLIRPGLYKLLLGKTKDTIKIEIKDQPYTDVVKAALKAFYYNRSGMAIESEYGGKWAREAGHPDTVVYIHSSAADELRPEGTIISSPLGWYDAGDFNKYIVNSGITTYTLLKSLQDYSSYHEDLNVDIPESGSGIPDLLSEIMYNLKWMLTMQDPNDGGVYHKLTAKDFEDMIMPHEAVSQRFVVAKGTGATLNFAAVTAFAHRILKNYNYGFDELSQECLQKAEKAWQWAIENPKTAYIQPKDITTGAYGDRNFDDEFFWAAAELYLSTGKDDYLQYITEKYRKPSVPTWGQVQTLGFLSLLTYYDDLPDILKELRIKNDFIKLVDKLVDISETSPYGVSINKFEWGSNSQVANEGVLKLFAYKITNNDKYFLSALSDLDYILGRNATGYCFVTGFGDKRVMNIHHRQSAADTIEDPIPGFLAGGPNLQVWNDCEPEIQAMRSKFAAQSYLDILCSYSTNEIAINWNAPLVYLVAAIDAKFN